MSVRNNYKGCCEINEATTFIISEEGINHCFLHFYKDRDEGLNIAKNWFVCWVAFNAAGREIKAGGIGFSKNNIRKNGILWIL